MAHARDNSQPFCLQFGTSGLGMNDKTVDELERLTE